MDFRRVRGAGDGGGPSTEIESKLAEDPGIKIRDCGDVLDIE